MPLTEFQRRKLLQDHGFDPEAFDLDEESGAVYEKEQKSPVVEAPVKPSSATKAFLTSAKSSIGSFAGGVGTIAAATPLNVPLATFGTTFAAPSYGLSYLPLVAAMLAEGGLGSIVGGKAQQVLEPKVRGETPVATQQRLAEEQQLRQEHPVASFLGEVAPQLAVARPSPRMLAQGAGAIGRLVTGAAKRRPLIPTETRALENLGLGGALGFGAEAANQVLGEQPFSAPRLAGSTALGAIISKPYQNRINRALGIAGEPEAPRPEIGELRDILQSGEPLPKVVERLEKLRDKADISPDYKQLIEETLLPNLKTKTTEEVTPTGIETVTKDIVVPEKSAKETAEVFKKTGVFEREKLETELGKLALERGELTPKDFETKITEFQEKAKKQDFQTQLDEINRRLEAMRSENEMLRLRQQEKQVGVEREVLGEVTRTGVAERKPVTTPKLRAQVKDLNYKAYVKARREGDLKTAEFYAKDYPEFKAKYESGDITEFEPVRKEGPTKTYFQAEEAGLPRATQEETPTEKAEFAAAKELRQKELEEAGISTTPTTGLLKFFRQLGKIRNYRVKLDNTLERPVYDREGNLKYEPVKGVALPRKDLETALTKINPRIASIDTLGHEPFHIFLADLKNSPSKIDRNIATRFEEMVSNIPEYQTAKSNDPGLTPHEFAVENTGYDIVRRLFNTDKEGGTWKGWWKDFIGDLKIKWGKASPSDYTRLLSNRFLTDKPFSETFGGATPPPPKPTIAEQQETTLEKGPESAKIESKTDAEVEGRGIVEEQKVEPTGRRETTERQTAEEATTPSEKGGEGEVKQPVEEQKQIPPKTEFQGEEAGLETPKYKITFEPGFDKSKPWLIKDKDERLIAQYKTRNEAESKIREVNRRQVVEETVINNRKKELLENYKKTLASRLPFRETKVQNVVEAETNIGKKQVGGVYNFVKDEIVVMPDSPNIALHESIHQLNFRNRPTLNALANRANPEDIKTIYNVLSDVHPIYEANLKDASPFRILEEGIATIAGPPNKLTTDLKLKLAASVENILGSDFTDFLVRVTKSPEYYPRFKRTKYTEDRINQLLGKQEQIIESFDKKYRDPETGLYKDASLGDLAKMASDIEVNLREINKLKEEDPGFYYQRIAQGLDDKTINANRELVRRGKDFQKEGTLKTAVNDLSVGRLPIIGSDIDKFISRAGYVGKKLGPALREFFAVERANQGKYLFPTLESLNKLNDVSIDKIETKMLKEKRLEQSFRHELNTEEQKAYDVIRKVLKQKQEDQIKAGQPVIQINKDGSLFHRLPKVNEFYVPEVVGRKQLDILLNTPDSSAARLLKDDFIKTYTEKYSFTEKAASDLLDDVLASYGGALKSDSTHFNAVRKSEGIGLPDTWKEQDFKRALERYWRRVSKDRAFYDTIEKDHNLATIIGQRRDAWGKPLEPTDPKVYSAAGNDILNSIMNIVQGRPVKINPRLDALSRISSNIILGPLTGLNDFVAGPGLLAKFIPSVGDIPGFMLAAKDIGKGIKHAQQSGFIKQKISDYQDLFVTSTEFVDKLNSLANNITKWTGRDAFEKWSRGLTQGLAEYLIPLHKKLALSGDVKSQKLLSGLSKDWKNIAVPELASRLGELTQGTYDPRGLPGFVLDSPLAPILRLSKWGIEQSNNFYKHVLMPAKQGNIAPLMYSLFGASIGGYIIKEMREATSAKELSIPSLKEIAASEKGFKGNIPETVYNFMAASTYAGTFGVVGDILKAMTDVYHKNTPQGFNYPLAEIVGDSTVKIGHAVQAMIDGENPAIVAPKLLSDILKDNTQVWRLALNNYNRVIGEQQYKDAAARRDLRVFKMVENLPYSPQGSGDTNPYENLETKKFKQTADVKEAVELFPELIKDAIKKAQGNPERLRELLRRIKINSLQTMPSPESKPREFSKFKNYLVKTKGEKEATARTKNYLIRREINKAKSALVP